MRTLVALFLSVICFSANAQDLTGVQQIGIRVDAAEMKVDGQLTEWDHRLQFYNKTCEIRYSIANTTDRLYLAIQATDIEIIEKIISGGITFTVNANGVKKGNNGGEITFPFYETGKLHPYLMLHKIKELKSTAPEYDKRRDSLQNSGNEQIKKSFKFIATSGLMTVKEEMIPVYNEHGISAAAMLDNSLYYNFELSIPLKMLNVNPGSKSFAYNIRLNGPAYRGSNLRVERDKFLIFTGADGKSFMMGDATPRNWSLASPTDFWGEYTLATY